MPRTINAGFEDVPLALLKPHERNPNMGDFGAIQESIQQNGFYGAVVAQKSTGKVLAGNHRLAVAKQEGFETLPVIWVDCSDEEALRILLADNRLSRIGHDDEAALAALLAELASTPTGLKGVGFDGDDLDEMIGRLASPGDGDWADAIGGLPDGDKAPFQQMTFTLHDSQAATVEAALKAAQDAGPFEDSPNENSNGNALDRIACFFLRASAANHAR